MRKLLRQFSIFIALLAAFTIIRFPYDSYSTDIEAYIKKQASLRKVLVDIDHLKLSMPPALSFDRIGILFPAFLGSLHAVPVPVVLDSGLIRLRLFPLLLLRVEGAGHISLYGGTSDLVATKHLLQHQFDFNFTAKDLDVSKHPFFSGIDASGIANVRFNGEDLGSGKQRGYMSLQLKDASYGGGMLQSLIKIPSISDAMLSLSLKLKKTEIAIEKCELLSSVGSVSCHGTGDISTSGSVERFSGSALIRLSGDGIDAFSGYLALLAKRNPDEKVRNWALTWSVEGPKVKVSAAPG
jgi:type II secretion system protein N